MRSEVRGVWLGAGTLLALILILSWPPLARRGMGWLDKSEPPQQADLLVVVGGGARERLVTAVRLRAEGYIRDILVTGSAREISAAREFLVLRGVPDSSIIRPPAESHSTLEDALVIRRFVREQPVGSILAVTSPYHTRRLGLLLGRSLSGTGVRLTITASESLYLDLNRWWADRQGWVLIPTEYVKLMWLWGVGSPAPVQGGRPPEVTGTP